MKVEDILKESPNILTTLQRAFDACGIGNGWTPQDVVLYALQSPQDFHIWKISDETGVAIAYGSTRSIHYPNASALSIVTLANVKGDPVEWDMYQDTIRKVEELAVAGNYDKIEITGRLGWRKRIKPLGYEMDYVTFSKEI